MQPGDLVRFKPKSNRKECVGLVVEYFTRENHFQECVRVKWPFGEEIEWLHTLEVINEAR